MATKKYTDELIGWVKTKPAKSGKKSRRDLAAVAFVAVKSDVQEAIDAGLKMKLIWEHMRATKRIDFTYETFRLHVNKQLRKKGEVTSGESMASEPAAPITRAARTTRAKPEKASASGIKTFNFDPLQTSKDLL